MQAGGEAGEEAGEEAVEEAGEEAGGRAPPARVSNSPPARQHCPPGLQAPGGRGHRVWGKGFTE